MGLSVTKDSRSAFMLSAATAVIARHDTMHKATHSRWESLAPGAMTADMPVDRNQRMDADVNWLHLRDVPV